MIALPINDATRQLARRVVWWIGPDEALADPKHVIFYALEYGTAADVALVIKYVGMDGIALLLKEPRPGILSGRSWSYWHAMTGTWPPPPMPERALET